MVLNGRKPGEMPVEQPTSFELVIQSQNREGTRPDDPPVAAAARR
jgi:hypothetical protein